MFYTDSSGETMQTIISRSAQIGLATGLAGTMGSFSKGAPVRVIGASFTGGSQLYWYVRADSSIRSVRDAEGKTVSYSSTGSSVHAAVLALMKFSGVNMKPTPTGSSIFQIPGTKRVTQRNTNVAGAAAPRQLRSSGKDITPGPSFLELLPTE